MGPPAEPTGPAPGERQQGSRQGRARWFVLGALVVVVAYAGWAASEVVRNVAADDRETTDAIVVLGAAQYDGTPSPVLRARLDHARDLYRAGVAPKVVLTGSKQPADRFTEAYAGFTYLLGEGVPEGAMAVVTDGDSTYESLAATARVLEDQGANTITLVSDGYHNRRMIGIASELGLEASVSGSDSSLDPVRVAKEAAVVGVGELIGFRRLQRFF